MTGRNESLIGAQVDDWRTQAAKWLRAKADAQERKNSECPGHVECYPSWSMRVRQLRWDAEELETGRPWGSAVGDAAVLAALTGAQPAPAAPSGEVMLNGLTRAETGATASVQGLTAAQPADSAMTDEQIDAIFHANHNPEESPWVNWRRFARALTAASKERSKTHE